MKKTIQLFQKVVNSTIPHVLREEYSEYKFYHNNVRTLFVAAFLFFEQAVYGLFIAARGSLEQEIYYYSALIMLATALIAYRFYKKRLRKIRTYHKLFEVSLAVIGMGVALLRILLVELDVFRVPTIYIAVLYGVAVILFLPKGQSFILYAAISTCAILLIPVFHPQIETSSYAADIVSNGLIAWIISAINYRNFAKDFLNKKTIQRKNRELEELSIKDGLTGLFNRRKLDSVLKEIGTKAERYGSDFSVIILDIDHFKRINDTYGHDAGDKTLKSISAILQENVRDVDTCGRWGGEEFLVVCPETDKTHGYLLAEMLRKLISSCTLPEGMHVTASFGIASYSEQKETVSLLKTADHRLYEAKITGRNKTVAGEDGEK